MPGSRQLKAGHDGRLIQLFLGVALPASSFLERLLRPLVHAEARQLRGDGRSSVNLGRDAEHNLSRIRALWRLSDFLASREIIVDGFAKGGFQSFDSISVKADNVGDPRDMTDKYFVVAVKFDAGYITLV
jgi:hypothetical protein